MTVNLPQTEQQINALTRFLKRNKKDHKAWLALAHLQFRSGNTAAALHSASKSAKLRPSLNAYLLVAEVFQKQEQWERALKLWTKCTRMAPQDARLYNKAGLCLVRMEEFDQAEKQFLEAVKRDPETAEWQINAAMIQALRGNSVLARNQIAQILSTTMTDQNVHHTARVAHDVLGEHIRLNDAVNISYVNHDLERLIGAISHTATDGFSEPDQTVLSKAREFAELCEQQDYSSMLPPGDLACDELRALEDLYLTRSASIDHSMEMQVAQLKEHSTHFETAIADSYQTPDGSPEKYEAWLRYWHAHIMWKRSYSLPGQFKLVNNAVGGLLRTSPENVVGTIRSGLAEHLPNLSPGLSRGIFLHLFVGHVHPFADGNGRLARFLMSREFESEGLPACAVSPENRRKLGPAIISARNDKDLRPMLELIMNCWQNNSEIIRRLRVQ